MNHWAILKDKLKTSKRKGGLGLIPKSILFDFGKFGLPAGQRIDALIDECNRHYCRLISKYYHMGVHYQNRVYLEWLLNNDNRDLIPPALISKLPSYLDQMHSYSPGERLILSKHDRDELNETIVDEVDHLTKKMDLNSAFSHAARNSKKLFGYPLTVGQIRGKYSRKKNK